MARLVIIVSLLQISLLAGILKIDISSSSHSIGVSSKLDKIIINWSKPATTNGDIISRYRWKFDNISSSDLENDKNANEIPASSNSIPISLKGKNDGDWYFHIIAITESGDSGSDTVFGKIIVDRTAPSVLMIDKILDSQAVEISLKSSDNKAKIYFTLDKTKPTTDSQKYKNPFIIYSSKNIKFIGVDLTKNQSKVFEKSVSVNYSKNRVKFSNITNGSTIATKSINGALKINPQISVSTSNSALISYKYRFDSNKYSNSIFRNQVIDITNLSDGLHTLYAKGIDNLGNTQLTDSKLEFTIDNQPPKSIKSYIDNHLLGSRNIFSTGKTLTLALNEKGTIRYTIDGTLPTKTSGKIYNKLITVTNSTTFKFIAFDTLGNIGKKVDLKIIIDREKPTLPKIFDSNMSELNSSNIAFYKNRYLYDKKQYFTFTSSDNHTQNPKIYWTLDGKTPTLLNSNSGNLSIKSTSTLKFIAADTVNNYTNIQSIDFMIDKTAPKSLSFSLSDGCIKKNSIYNCTKSNVNIILNAIDNETPDDLKIYFTQNGGLPTKESSTLKNGGKTELKLTQNEKTLKFVAYDKVGNRSETKIIKLRYDIENVNKSLEMTTSLSLENNSSINSKKVKKIDVNISNGGKNIVYYYKLNNQKYLVETNISNSIDISNLLDGSHTLSIIASNGENNSSNNQITFLVDNTPPPNPEISGLKQFKVFQDIKIMSKDKSAKIFYSIDGTSPSTQSLEYVSPFKISKSLLIKAFAIDNIGNISDEVKKSFTLITSKIETNNTDENISKVVSNSDKTEKVEPNKNQNSKPIDTSENFNDANIVKNNSISNNDGKNVGESLTIENSYGKSKIIKVYYPKDTIFSDNGNKTYTYTNQNILQTTTVSQNGSVSTKIKSDKNLIEIKSNLESQNIFISKNGDINISSEEITSDSRKISRIELKVNSTKLEIKLYLNNKLIDFPVIDLSGENASIHISLKSDNSINIELNIPLSYKNLIF